MRASPTSLQVRSFAASLGAVLLLLVGTTANAQSEPPPSAPPPVTVTGGGNGIGVGASAFLSGVAGVQVDYDTPLWDADAILGFADRSGGNGNNAPSQTQIQFGVQGWYHLHRGSSSDFSVGGGIGLDHTTGAGPNLTATVIELGARPRAFITSNVAVHAMLGISITVGDNGVLGAENKGVGIGAQPLFGAGFTYYFR
jgi:hypothetical protein